jgi:hypothetical protein
LALLAAHGDAGPERLGACCRSDLAVLPIKPPASLAAWMIRARGDEVKTRPPTQGVLTFGEVPTKLFPSNDAGRFVA